MNYKKISIQPQCGKKKLQNVYVSASCQKVFVCLAVFWTELVNKKVLGYLNVLSKNLDLCN